MHAGGVVSQVHDTAEQLRLLHHRADELAGGDQHATPFTSRNQRCPRCPLQQVEAGSRQARGYVVKRPAIVARWIVLGEFSNIVHISNLLDEFIKSVGIWNDPSCYAALGIAAPSTVSTV